MTEKNFVEVNEENLRHYYLELNTRIVDMSDVFGIPMGTIRKRLKKFGIEKSQKQAGSNISESQKVNGNSHLYNLHKDKELMQKARAKGAASRKANRLESLNSGGATYEAIYRMYIIDNKSLLQISEKFNFSMGKMRKVLQSYKIVKTKEKIIESRQKAFAELYADSERVAEMVAKTAETNRERYGNNWYHNTASKEEMAVKEMIEEAFPNLEIVHGSYGIIRRPGSGGLMQLDFYFPEISLAIEYNGIYWHDKAAYLEDLANGTECSREALKDRLCGEESIDLVHIWSDEWKLDVEENFIKLSAIISERLLKVELAA